MRSGALEGFEVHPRGLGSVGSEREQTNGVVTKEESAEQWTHAAKRTYYTDLEKYGVREEGAEKIFTRHCVACDSTISHCRELPHLCGLEASFSIGCV